MKKSLETICIHGGWKPTKGEPQQLPIYQSTTFKYDTSEQMARLFDLKDSGYFYTRLANPTNDAVAKKIAALEGGIGAVLTSSGQAANFYAVHNQSLRIKGNRGKRKECNYLEYHHLAFSYYFKGKRKRASNGRSSVTKS